MKKLIYFVSIVLLCSTVHAQTEKGNLTFRGSGTLSFSSTNAQAEFEGEDVGNEQSIAVVTLNPSVGYFVIENLSVNLDFEFQSSTFDDGETDTNSSSTGAFLGGNYFFDAGSENIKPFVGLSAGFMATSNGDEDFQKSNGFAYVGRAGVSYFINKNISVDFLVRYLNSKMVNKEESDFSVRNSNFGIGLGFSFFL
jgi:outer membrane protein